MTKLAPIEEFTKFGMREHRGLTVFNDVELELVRQAIIRDFVSTVEPVAIVNKKTPSWYLQELIGVFKLKHGTKLYAFSDWSNK